ncbi:unnamed protein product, partial [Ceratitis capitata]
MVLRLNDTTLKKCTLSQGQHKPADCKRLTEASVGDRWTEVKARRLCFACLNRVTLPATAEIVGLVASIDVIGYTTDCSMNPNQYDRRYSQH